MCGRSAGATELPIGVVPLAESSTNQNAPDSVSDPEMEIQRARARIPRERGVKNVVKQVPPASGSL